MDYSEEYCLVYKGLDIFLYLPDTGFYLIPV